METKETKFHPVLAFAIMFILLLLIALPPLFRVLFPKIEEIVPAKQDNIKTITCSRNYPTENISEKVEIRYINAKIDQTRITYAPYTPTAEEITEIRTTPTTEELLPSQELAYFQNIQGIQLDKIDTRTLITINQDIISQNSDNTNLKTNYFNNNEIDQKLYFTNRSFECSEEEVN